MTAEPSLPALPDTETARRLLARMLLVRRFEERCVELYSASRIRGFLHLYIGEEAVAVGVIDVLSDDEALFSTYREHGHALARGVDPSRLMAEMFGMQEGVSHGRGGSMHLFDTQKRFYGGSAIVGGGLPLAVGLALADHMRDSQRVTACFFGEGAVAEGEFHECMNLAALWRLPVLFCCENNLYAMGTALERSESQADLCVKASSYGVAAHPVDGMDVAAVYEESLNLHRQILADGRPRFLECRTYRFRAHSMFDPDLYRDKAEIEEWKTRGPIHTFSARLKQQGWLTEERFLELDATAAAEVQAAVAFAEAGQFEDVADLARDVYTGGMS